MITEEKEAFSLSLKILARGPKSVAELMKRLREKGVAEETAAKVLSGLESRRYIDDERLAQDILDRYTGSKPSGRQRIVLEFRKRGIPEALQRRILESYTGERESEAALELARRKWQALAGSDDLKRKKKTFDFLLRRGFRYEVASAALQKLAGFDEEF